MSGKPSPLKIVVAFAAVYFIWGSTYLAIKFGLETLPPFTMAAARFLVAGALLYGWTRLRGVERPKGTEWRSAVIVGGLMLLGGNGLVTWSERLVPSGVAALIVAAVPLFMVVLQGERPAVRTVVGLVLGFVGIATLVGPGRLGGEPVDPWGAGALVLASLSWAAGSLYSRKAPQPSSGIAFAGMEMLGGGALLALVGVITGEWRAIHPSAISLKSILSVGYLVTFGSLIGFTAYVWLLQVTTPARASTYAYVNPVVAVILGWLLAGEPMTARVIVAAIVIVGAVAMIVSAPARRRREEAPTLVDRVARLIARLA